MRKRRKKASKKYRDEFGHTPLSVEEEIPWKCKRLVVGTGTGALPVMDEVKREDQAAQNRARGCAHRTGNRVVGATRGRYQRHPACHLLRVFYCVYCTRVTKLHVAQEPDRR